MKTIVNAAEFKLTPEETSELLEVQVGDNVCYVEAGCWVCCRRPNHRGRHIALGVNFDRDGHWVDDELLVCDVWANQRDLEGLTWTPMDALSVVVLCAVEDWRRLHPYPEEPDEATAQEAAIFSEVVHKRVESVVRDALRDAASRFDNLAGRVKFEVK